MDTPQELARIQGTLVIYGYHSLGLRTVNMERWNWKGLTIINGHERDFDVYTDGIRRGLNLMEWWDVIPNLITHQFPLKEINEGYRMMEESPAGYIKALILP